MLMSYGRAHPSIHLVSLYLFVVAGASPGCHWGREPRTLATVLIPRCLHWWVRSYFWGLDSGSQIWTRCLLSIKLWRLMAACVGVFDTVLNTWDLIGFSVLWRCERLWPRSGPTLYFFATDPEEDAERWSCLLAACVQHEMHSAHE